jgi:WD40 repeat protein
VSKRPGDVSRIAFSAESEILITEKFGEASKIHFLSIENGDSTRPSLATTSPIIDQVFEKNPGRLQTIAEDGQVSEWDLSADPITTVSQTSITDKVITAKFAENGSIAVIDDGEAKVMVSRPISVVSCPVQYGQTRKYFALHPDGRRFFVADASGTIRGWDLAGIVEGQKYLAHADQVEFGNFSRWPTRRHRLR